MPGHYFISYSDADGRDFAKRLHDSLEPRFVAWFDKHDLKPGMDWDAQFRQAISACEAFLFVMTPDSADDTCTCHNEYFDALRFKKPIIPLKAHPTVFAPFRLNARQYIDFTGNYDAAIAKLREHLEWLKSPAGELQSLNDRLADANRDLRRADETNRPRIEADIAQLKQDIEKQKCVVENPQAAAERTQKSIDAGLEREREPAKPVSGTSRTKFINAPPMTAPRYFQDRYEENKLVKKFLEDDAQRVLTIVGRAGIGKTAMACRLLKSLEAGKMPDDLGALHVDGIVYLSAVGTRTVNVPNLFADLCQLVPTDAARELDALYKNPQASTEAKIHALLAAFPTGRVIVLLDNFETALDAETTSVRDAELNDALRTLLNAPHHAVKVMLTTRIAPRDLGLFQPARHARINLDEGLPSPFAENILHEMDADGKLGLRDAPAELLNRARIYTRGFPRALEALYAILSADRYTTLAEILGDGATVRAHGRAPLQNMPETVVDALVGEAFNRLDPTAERVMIALAVFNRPVPPAAIDYVLQPFLPSVDSAQVLTRLANMQFARRESGRYHLHPVDREYAIARVPKENNVTAENAKNAEENILSLRSWRPWRLETWTQKDLVTRAANYFRETRKPRETWKKIEDLEPQLNEFDLRCAAEDYDTAVSVLLDVDYEYLLLWGHFRLMIELHERLQGEIRDSRLKENSVGNLGSANYSIGQIPRAIACYEKALTFAREEKDRNGEGVWLGNLGLAYSALGETRRAVEFYERALTIAQEIGNKRGQGNHLGNLGNSYAELGETHRAIEFYERALAIDREIGDKRGEGADLDSMATVLVDQSKFKDAIARASESSVIAERIGYTLLSSVTGRTLALANLYSGDLTAGRTAAEAARKFDVPENNHNVAALLGIIDLRQSADLTGLDTARQSFTTAIAQADALLALTPELYDALDAKGIALCGLAIINE